MSPRAAIGVATSTATIAIASPGWVCSPWCASAITASSTVFCLMSNHFHLMLETVEPNLARAMRHLNGEYTQHFNRRHHTVGHLFQGRYKAILVQKESYLLELSRYIVLNPLRAKMVDCVEEWPWSSHRYYLGDGPAPPWLERDWLLSQFAGEAEGHVWQPDTVWAVGSQLRRSRPSLCPVARRRRLRVRSGKRKRPPSTVYT